MKVLIALQTYFKIPLHFKNFTEETLQSDIFARCGRKISPPLLNTCSVGELDAGTLRALIAGKYSLSNVRRCSCQNPKQSNEASYAQSFDRYLLSWAGKLHWVVELDWAALAVLVTNNFDLLAGGGSLLDADVVVRSDFDSSLSSQSHHSMQLAQQSLNVICW